MKDTGIIKKGYLQGLIVSALIIFMAGIALSSVFLYLDLYRPFNTHYGEVLSIVTEIRETLAVRTLKINSISSVLILTGLLALVVFYTHRIAGPLYRIKVSAKAISKGMLGTKTKFRTRDAIHPFAESLNEMAVSYSDRINTLRSELLQLKKSASELRALVEEGKAAETELKKLQEQDERINSLLSGIKL